MCPGDVSTDLSRNLAEGTYVPHQKNISQTITYTVQNKKYRLQRHHVIGGSLQTTASYYAYRKNQQPIPKQSLL